jgi:iron(III) transport system substrate-binding protein
VHPLGSHPYNLSLFGAVTEHLGDAKAEAWLKGVVSNLARAPKGVTPTRSRPWRLANAISP